ncbi:MAG: class I fructose-bisphosphate aldolase, partial [Sulfurimicrobium sp.]|nr:class I fructose-bisphosphate aldolase [Sulfurimicrobium sp.]
MTDISALLGAEAESLLSHQCGGIPASTLHLPGPDYVDRVVAQKDVKPGVMRALQYLFGHGRLANTGYLSILPVDQGVEHSGGASFAPNPIYFDPENIVRLAIEGGANAVASTYGVLGSVARKYAHKIPFIVKINHNEMLTYPTIYDQTLFSSVDQAFDMGAVAVGATVYFGSPEARRQIQEISEAFQHAHELGMATVLWASQIENLPVTAGNGAAKVILNARTGSVVMNQNVEVDNCAVAHGNLAVTITSETQVSQPNPLSQGATVATQTAQIDITAQKGELVTLPVSPSLSEVVKAL